MGQLNADKETNSVLILPYINHSHTHTHTQVYIIQILKRIMKYNLKSGLNLPDVSGLYPALHGPYCYNLSGEYRLTRLDRIGPPLNIEHY